jgi:SAM-dependent methyltransferase
LPVPTDFAEIGTYLTESRLPGTAARILDVGCGASPQRLAAMRRLGFGAVEGLDPYVPADLSYDGIPVYRRTIDQQQGEYDLIMFHHSLEHVTEPYLVLREAARLLRPGGTCLVRIPVMGTYFWRQFGVDWVELDAPRHLQLLTAKSMRLLAERVGLRVRKTVFDSEGWELAASRRYQQGIALRSTARPTDGFSADDLAAFAIKAEELNEQADAGRACFYLDFDNS